ncbi:hypothetical protein I316_07927 [Kwoniella heveanensis BCC8398]|uniref:Glycosyl transferase CAP10 domain-containing protein n=1 Tax=Kwoniella heveanensis BCC8398 TaxID=1296120 RepID=A0A1B9GHC3_9TREE|nr:hypothetical protein I316_07927 [Kwoniella heveanensis BCC8398]
MSTLDRSQPSPRIPYRATSTPPRTPLRLPAAPPFHASSRPGPTSPQSEYPESPTSGLKPHRSYPKPPPFSLGQPPPPRRRAPRFFRSPKRVLLYLVLLGLVGALARTVVYFGTDRIVGGGLRVGRLIWNRGKGDSYVENVDDGLCRFVSTVEAYHRDLARLRAMFPSTSHGNTTSSSSSPNHPNLHLHAQKHQHHTFSPTGHLIVSDSAEAPHPIPILISLGEKRWEELLSRQSRTLEEAVREYTRRYGRRPPRGFDAWWDFAMNHNLVLPDEYDRINLDLAPFFALPKDEMKRRMSLVEDMAETFTLVVEDGEVAIEIKDQGGLKWGGTLPRAQDTSSLLSAFSKYLPDMRATFSIFDQPQIYLSWARRASLVDLGLRGEHTTHLEETDSAHVKLSRSCAPDTHYRKNQTYSEGKSFIYDSLEAGDLCQSDSDILITPLDQFHDNPGKDPVWAEKDSSKLVWRGSPTGISMMSADLPWRQAHRVRLHHFAANRSSEPMQFLVPDVGQPRFPDDMDMEQDGGEDGAGDYSHNQEVEPEEDIERHLLRKSKTETESPVEERYVSPDDALLALKEELSTDQAMDFYYDMKLSGSPIQCSEEDGTCDDMRREIQWAGHQGAEELNKHKFLLDIDGNGWSGRFRRLMSTNSMVIKMTMFTEWFQPHLIPWFMYVPAKLDFSDLTDIMAFFRGTPQHPELGFDETAAALARNGQCFVQRMFRMEDLQAYMMRLFLEYARIAADEGVDMDFYLEDEEEGHAPTAEYEDTSEPELIEAVLDTPQAYNEIPLNLGVNTESLEQQAVGVTEEEFERVDGSVEMRDDAEVPWDESGIVHVGEEYNQI